MDIDWYYPPDGAIGSPVIKRLGYTCEGSTGLANLWLGKLSKADSLSECGQSSCSWLEVWVESKLALPQSSKRDFLLLNFFKLGHRCFLALWLKLKQAFLTSGACWLSDGNMTSGFPLGNFYLELYQKEHQMYSCLISTDNTLQGQASTLWCLGACWKYCSPLSASDLRSPGWYGNLHS